MKALILAAGFGTRLSPYTDITPKPLFEINNQPLLYITIWQLINAGCSSIIINTHHLHRQIESFIEEQTFPIPVATRYEPEILDTGGAIKNVADFLNNAPFFVVNSDIVTDIDYKKVYQFHKAHNHPATLVLHNFPEFNNVSVDDNKMIRGFHLENCSLSKLAFTGIQVLDPCVLPKIPDNKFTSSIALYKTLIKDGSGVKAFVAENLYWADIGTPEKYSTACIDAAAPELFNSTMNNRPEITKLKGDGSDRKWYRLSHNGESVILGDHGISNDPGMVNEIHSFISIGNHLYEKGVPVPKIFHSNIFPGHVFMKDLGDTDLEKIINRSKTDDTILSHYKKILQLLVGLSVNGGLGFDTSWTYQTTHYDKNLIIQNECNYFITAFVNRFTPGNVNPDNLLDEFTFLADKALEYQFQGFMHRDLQSKNIMIQSGSIYFIDFQGGRLGPVQYDIASLLIDPYVELPEDLQTILYDFFVTELSKEKKINEANFLESYRYLKITRNLQMLGAFGFLSRVKGKNNFEKYIPHAVKTLKKNIKQTDIERMPKLNKIIEGL